MLKFRTHNGYLVGILCKNGKTKGFSVHRLVAEAFLPNPLNLPQVNHKDEDKTNNIASNLEWCACKYNLNYGTCQQRKAAKLSKPIIQLDLAGNLLREWPSAVEVKRQFGFSQSIICNCCNGKRKTAYGSIWKFASQL